MFIRARTLFVNSLARLQSLMGVTVFESLRRQLKLITNSSDGLLIRDHLDFELL